MALTVGSDTYLSLTDANTYFGTRLHAESWTGATDGDKEKALRMAARLLNRQPWAGTLTDDDQLLAWPRAGLYDPEGRPVDQDAVPEVIETAQCELALAFLTEDLTASDTNRGVKRIKAGSVEMEFAGSAPPKRLPDEVSDLIAPYLEAGPTSDNSVRMVL